LFLYKRIGFRASYTFFFKQYRLLKYLFYNYFHKFSELNFKLIKKIYKAKLSITKFEKFLYYTESRVPTMLIRTKFARTHHQSFNFTLYGGVFVNNFKVLYYNYLIIIQDLIELAFRFFLYAFTKRYIRYFAFRPKMNKRSIIMRYYRVFKAGKRELFKSKQKMHTLKLFKNFFYKNMCLLAIIILEIPLKFEYRIFNKMFSFKTLMYLHVLN
jgi:ribosomal protein S4